MIGRFKYDNKWWSPIVSCALNEPVYGLFSEYETYGHYIKKYHQNEFERRKLAWRNIPGPPKAWKIFVLSKYYDYCSFHAHLRDVSDFELIIKVLKKPGNKIIKWITG
jgi:hypothetical protein